MESGGENVKTISYVNEHNGEKFLNRIYAALLFRCI